MTQQFIEQEEFTRYRVLSAIVTERAYQDAKYGTPKERRLSVDDYLHIARGELDESFSALADGDFDNALCELLQVVAVGVACLERHGLIERQTAQNAQEGT